MTTVRQRALMLGTIFALASVAEWEAMGMRMLSTLAFLGLALACAIALVLQVGGEA